MRVVTYSTSMEVKLRLLRPNPIMNQLLFIHQFRNNLKNGFISVQPAVTFSTPEVNYKMPKAHKLNIIKPRGPS